MVNELWGALIELGHPTYFNESYGVGGSIRARVLRVDVLDANGLLADSEDDREVCRSIPVLNKAILDLSIY